MVDKIVKIERVKYTGTVYNLEVEGDESYVAQGVVVHNCLCRKDAVLIDPDQFVNRLRGWAKGESAWPEMDQYANWVGGTKSTMKTVLGPTTEVYKQLTLPLFTWLGGSETKLDALLDGGPE